MIDLIYALLEEHSQIIERTIVVLFPALLSPLIVYSREIGLRKKLLSRR